MHTVKIGAVCVNDRYANSSLRIQLPTHTAQIGQLYAEGMYDTYAYNSFEHIYRYIVMSIFGLDYDRTLLLLVGEVILNVFLNTGMCAFSTHRMCYRVYR